MSSLDHIGISAADFQASKSFYASSLAPLGVTVVMAVEVEEYSGVGFGRDDKPDFWVSKAPAASGPIHVAFSAHNSHEVDAFYAAAMASGGKDNGAPGIREHYHPGYYAAFVFDPDGNNVEAVFHGGKSP